MTAMFADEITDDFLDGIYQETEGNPYFVEEICRALVEGGQLTREEGRWRRPEMDELTIPRSLRLTIQTRLEKLPETAQETLFMVAAERSKIISELRRVRAAPPRFTFYHALIPMILYDATGSMRRRKYHRKVAEAIAALHPDDLEKLAYHS